MRFQSTFPRGERRMGETSLNYVLYFNPRSRVGNDLILPDQDISIALFQSTFPRGERHQLISSWRVKIRFQSTFPRGERLGGLCFLYAGYQFQSTFPRGERPLSPQCNPYHYQYFNPRSRVGNDAYLLRLFSS